MTCTRVLLAASVGLLLAAARAAAQTPTTVTLNAPATPTILGQAASFDADVAPAGATGRVVFWDGAAAIGEAPLNGLGRATFTLATLPVGPHAIRAEYLGDGAFGAGGSPAIPYTVAPRPCTATFSVPNPAQARVDAAARATVTVRDASTVGPPGVPGAFSVQPWTMHDPRAAHTATRLRDGRVLVVGGRSTSAPSGALSTAELYDPATGTFALLATGLHAPRQDHTATLLQDGTVLIAGGLDASGTSLASAELFDPVTGQFTALTATLQTARHEHAAVLLPDGSVLLLGGTAARVLASAEVYRGGAFQAVDGALATARTGHTATLLADGASVLVTGGLGTGLGANSSVELVGYDPSTHGLTHLASAAWTAPRYGHTATALADGGILIAGGLRGASSPDATAVLYRLPAALAPFPPLFTSPQVALALDGARGGQTATLLLDGRVLVTGGVDASNRPLSTAATYRPRFEPNGATTIASSDPTDLLSAASIYVASNGDYQGSVAVTPTAMRGGRRTITVSYTTDANHSPPSIASATFDLAVLRGIPAILWSPPSSLVYGTVLGDAQLNATAASRDAAVPGTFTYDPPAGTVPTAGYHTLRVTFAPADATTYEAAGASRDLTVYRATPSIAWGWPADIEYGTALGSAQLNAVATGVSGPIAGTYLYSPPAGTVPSSQYQAMLSVSFTPYDTLNYYSTTGYTWLNVRPATFTLDWSDPSAITYGTPLSAAQLNAVAQCHSFGVAGTYTYTPAAGTVLPVGAAQPLMVTFNPTDPTNYTGSSTRTVHVDVLPGVPTLRWDTPTDIVYGTPLSAEQLDATASGPSGPLGGTFRYEPGTGTILGAGPAQTLSVSFTPTDPSYSPASVTTLLNVRRATPVVTWERPDPIDAGTPLGPEQLDARFTWAVGDAPVTVAGTAIYSPPAGTTLPAGAGQELQVQFVPDDVLDFDAPQTRTVTIDVWGALTITPSSTSVAPGTSTTFSAWGGSGAGWIWSLASAPSGGKITAEGVYTAGDTTGVSDVVRVEDSAGHAAIATVVVERGSPPEGDAADGGGGCGCGSGGAGSAPPLAVGLLLALGRRRRRRA